jgi:hypothetical protein
MRIRSGRDIFGVGEVIQVPGGGLRVLARYPHHDTVEYEVEPVIRMMLSHHQPVRPLARARAALSRLREALWPTK